MNRPWPWRRGLRPASTRMTRYGSPISGAREADAGTGIKRFDQIASDSPAPLAARVEGLADLLEDGVGVEQDRARGHG